MEPGVLIISLGNGISDTSRSNNSFGEPRPRENSQHPIVSLNWKCTEMKG
jgi:hypothetical protein